VADSGKGAFDGRSRKTGSGILPFRDAEVHIKPRKAKPGNKNLLKTAPEQKTAGVKLKSSKKTSKTKENNKKINRKKKTKC